MTKIEVLKKCRLVRDMSDEELKVMAEIASPEVFEVGESLCKQGRTLEKLYLIEEGLVGIYLELGPMTHRQIQAASNYEIIGWSAVLPPHRANTTVKAIETTKVLAFSGKKLIDLCNTNPHIGCMLHRGIACVVADRLKHAFTQLTGVTTHESG